MKRLLDEAEPTLGALTALVASTERHQPSPFAKRHVQSRLSRALERGASTKRRLARPALLACAALFVAASAAATGYTLLSAKKSEPPTPVAAVAPTRDGQRDAPRRVAHVAAAPAPAISEPATVNEAPSAKRVEKPRAGEDPSQVAEAVRALRKQGDATRAQALLDQYLKANPRGALAEDALALSIEAAAARKDPRAADYARRYLAKYPNGRFKSVAERVLSR